MRRHHGRRPGSRDLKLWFADGTNYPGQDDIVARQDRLAEALAEVYERLGDDQRILLEYKLFEPAFYTMDVPDWGTAFAHCIALGPKAQVVIDTGHHAPGTNIEFIVAMLLRAGKLGGFDFNSRFYADDDLMVGAADPFQLFRIMWEVRRGGGLDPRPGVAFMLDQCHNIEPKIAGQIRSVMNVQEATAKALLRRRRRAGRRPGRRRRARRQRRVHGRLRHRRAAAARPSSVPTPAWIPIRWPPTTARATTRRCCAERAGGAAGGLGGVSERRQVAVTDDRRPSRRRADRAVEPARRRPAQHQLRRRQHLGQGRRTSTRSPASPVELLWVKGSGGDLGTLTADGLAVLRLDRLRALVDVYPGVEREDEMVAAFDFCRHGQGGAAPSIDTAMHGLVEAPHVDHLHPDAGIALGDRGRRRGADQGVLRRPRRVGPWRRPGFQLGLDIAGRRSATTPQAIGVILGGHGITAWGATSDECEANSLEIIRTAQAFLDARGRAEPFGAGRARLRAAARRPSGGPAPPRWRR